MSGAVTEHMMNRTAPLDESLTGQAIRTGKPRLVTGDRRKRPPPSWAPIPAR